MSRSRSHYDSDSDDQYGNRTILVKTQNDTFYKHGSTSGRHHYPQHVHAKADGMLAIPENTTYIYRSASTDARPQRGTVNVIHRSNTRSRSSSRSRSPERGRTLDTNRAMSIYSISDHHHDPQRAYVAADGMLAIPKSTTHIYRSASTGARPQQGTVKVIHRSHSRGRTLDTNRPILIDCDEKIYHSHHHRSRSYTSRSRSRSQQAEINVTRLDVNRPSYIRVNQKYLSPDTLDAYNLPWEWDLDTNYIIIKQWVSYDDQQVLFAHTRKIRESRVVISQPTTKKTVTTTKVTTLKPNRDRDKMYVVRKRDKSWSPTTVVYRKDKSPTRATVVYRKDKSPTRATVVYRKDKSPTRTTVVYRKDKSPTRTTVVYKKKGRSRSPTTIVYKKKDKSRSPTTIVYT